MRVSCYVLVLLLYSTFVYRLWANLHRFACRLATVVQPIQPTTSFARPLSEDRPGAKNIPKQRALSAHAEPVPPAPRVPSKRRSATMPKVGIYGTWNCYGTTQTGSCAALQSLASQNLLLLHATACQNSKRISLPVSNIQIWPARQRKPGSPPPPPSRPCTSSLCLSVMLAACSLQLSERKLAPHSAPTESYTACPNASPRRQVLQSD